MTTKFYNVDTDGTLSSDSDYRAPSQKAVKTYVDALKAYVDQQIGGQTIIPDDVTLTKDSTTNVGTVIGVKTKNNVIKYDWIGTKADWQAGRAGGTIPDNWVCYITDDSQDSSSTTIVTNTITDFDSYDPVDRYTLVHTTQGTTSHSPQDVTADWVVCYMKTSSIKIQIATRVDNPAIQLTRTYNNNAWTDWTYAYAAYAS